MSKKPSTLDLENIKQMMDSSKSFALKCLEFERIHREVQELNTLEESHALSHSEHDKLVELKGKKVQLKNFITTSHQFYSQNEDAWLARYGNKDTVDVNQDENVSHAAWLKENLLVDNAA